jgi:hypothetical protein
LHRPRHRIRISRSAAKALNLSGNKLDGKRVSIVLLREAPANEVIPAVKAAASPATFQATLTMPSKYRVELRPDTTGWHSQFNLVRVRHL